MKVGIITFSASHNYGSMLQAYALQQTVVGLGHECEIINLRVKIQNQKQSPSHRLNRLIIKMLNVLRHPSRLIKILKALRYPLLTIGYVRKHQLFERFLNEKYILSVDEYASSDELKSAQLNYDCYISGSDQIWNTSCADFSTAFYLDFVEKGRRIAYAPSMGPVPSRVADSFSRFIADSLSLYDAISVREPGTAERVRQITGRDSVITADPTLLLSPEEWSSLVGDKPLIRGEYILLYTPWYEEYKDLYVEAAAFAESKGMKVICTIPEGYIAWHRNRNFRYFIAAGPLEFLNLIKNARYVFCGSFHAVAFSLIFNRPFYAYKGMEDSRISHLLEMTGLAKCAENPYGIESSDFAHAHKMLRPFIESSVSFLRESLK